jgi:hypothetical protein
MRASWYNICQVAEEAPSFYIELRLIEYFSPHFLVAQASRLAASANACDYNSNICMQFGIKWAHGLSG